MSTISTSRAQLPRYRIFFDIERVEVVRGPQGVLYGRNATGGAIRVHTRRPEEGVRGTLKLTRSERAASRIEGAVNLPIIENTLLMRFAGLYTEGDGFTTDVLRQTTLDGEGLHAFRAHLAFVPSTEVRVLLSTDYVREDSTRFLGFHLNPERGGSLAQASGGACFLRPSTNSDQ